MGIAAYRTIEQQRELALRVARAERERKEAEQDANFLGSLIMAVSLTVAWVLLRSGVGLLAWFCS